MASPTGGQWVFGLGTTTGFSSLALSTSLGNGVPFPGSVAGALNIEVFTAGTQTTADPGFQGTATDIGAAVIGGFLVGSPLTLGAADYLLTDTVVGAHSPGNVTLGTGKQTVVGGPGDTVTGGSGSQVLSGIVGTQSITGGTGTYSVFGGTGDTIVGNSAATSTTSGLIIAQLASGAGQMAVTLPTAGTNTIFSGGGDTITGGPTTGGGSNVVFGWKGDTINLTGDNGSVVVVGAGVVPGFAASVAGGDSIVGGTGTQSLFGTTGDTLVGGQGGSEQIIGSAGSIVVGSGGSETIASLGSNTITALTGNASPLMALGAKDTVNLTGNTGSELIVGATGVAVTVGGSGSVGGAGIVGAAGELFTLGAGGNDVITGSSVAGGAGDTIVGTTAANLTYNPGATATSIVGGDFINLAGSTGTAVINAFSNGTIQGAVNDTIIAGNAPGVGTVAGTAVFGGGGDRIGVGNGATVSGTDVWLHSTSVAGAAIAFGTNDTVLAATYGATPGAVTVNSTLAGASSAKVTVGSATSTVSNFNTVNDSIFYQGETTALTASIVATATTTSGNTTFILPDGTTMTLIGVGAITPTMFK